MDFKRRKTLIGTNHTENMTWDEEVPLLACKEKGKRRKPNTKKTSIWEAELQKSQTNNKQLSNCLGVYGLENTITDEETILSAYGNIERVEVMKSKLTGNSLGFALIYFENPENAKLAHMSLLNSRLDDKTFMVEFPISPKENDGLSSTPSTPSTIPLLTPRSTPQTSPEVPLPGAGSSTFSLE